MTDYRSDWSVQRLGDFALHEKGSKPKRSQKNADDIFKYPYVDIQAFEKGIVKEYTDGNKCVFCEENDFLMVWDGSRSGYVGKAIKGALGSTLMKISFPGIETDYAYYFLQSKYLEINTRAKGTGTPHVDPGILWNYLFAIPPLSEQLAIVAKIEQLFSELDNGIASLKTAQEQLKVYHQAVLKQAFEGALTKAWREQQTGLPTAQELLEKITSERELAAKNQGKKLKSVKPLTKAELDELPELPKNWKWINIDTVSDYDKNSLKAGPFGSLLKKEVYVSKGYKVYGQEQVIKEDAFYGDYFIDKKKYDELSAYKVKLHDILISLVGTVGKILILPENFQEGIINPRLIKISLNKNNYYPPFFKYYFECSFLKKVYSARTQGTTMDILNMQIIKTLPFPFCSLHEQVQIVQEIETRLSVCDNIEATIRESLEKAEALRQSILKKAFEGKLLSNDELEATRNDPEWEPAGKLLERIRSEKMNSRNRH
ncbi:MAG: restriction endonuclease [Chlorobium sp.]|nr:MAG: restriction endonuclease [Chlorobium sp.]